MWAFLAASAITAGVQVYNGYQRKKAAEKIADTMDDQAAITEKQAEYAKASLYEQADDLGVQGQKYIGQQKTQYASAGVKLDVGSPLQVMRESQRNINKDVARLKEKGNNALELGINQADVQREKASMMKKYGQNSMTAGMLNGGASLLGGFANASPYTDLW